jgi:hypothetical protein
VVYIVTGQLHIKKIFLHFYLLDARVLHSPTFVLIPFFSLQIFGDKNCKEHLLYCARIQILHPQSKLNIIVYSSLGRYVFGSEISYNKAPPRLPGLGC